MTTKEKLQKALEALRFIGDCAMVDNKQYASDVYAELTAQKLETVEVVRAVGKYP